MANNINKTKALAAVRDMITYLGEDANRSGLIDTPKRVIESFEERLAGYAMDPQEILSTTFDDINYNDELVLLKNIRVESICEHHLLPFIGKAYVAYIPGGKIVGISKLARIVEAYSKRLQVQERLTTQIAEAIQEHLKPKGVAVLIEATHYCIMLRGVKNNNCKMITSRYLGAFDETLKRQEFLQMVLK